MTEIKMRIQMPKNFLNNLRFLLFWGDDIAKSSNQCPRLVRKSKSNKGCFSLKAFTNQMNLRRCTGNRVRSPLRIITRLNLPKI
ncbi:MAG: hypothetical protein D6714_06765 [Bacteroidetes bacterium]|nr:MAG: hypothetical protein D6714_06765 [Bacteroidota bacterium]